MDSYIEKENIFCIFLKFDALKQYTYQKKFFLNLSKKYFTKIYFVDISFIENEKKKNYKKEYIKDNFYSYFAPKNKKQFLSFFLKKKTTAILNTGRSWFTLKTLFLLKKIRCNLIQISNVGNAQGTEYKNYKSFISQNLNKSLPHKLYLFLSSFNIIPKIDIRFITNKQFFDKINSNFIINFLKVIKINFLSAKKFVLINSLAHDEANTSKEKLKNRYIVMLNTNINHKDAVKFSGKLSSKKVIIANKKLEFFLEKVSKILKKKVVICSHPSSNIAYERRFFKNFKVVQYQTKKYIKLAHIVFLYETSSIVDAFILGKKIVALENSAMGQNWINQSNQYPSKAGILKINIDNGLTLKHKNKLQKLIKQKKNSLKYNKFVKLNLIPDRKNINGTEKTLKIIKRLYNNEFF